MKIKHRVAFGLLLTPALALAQLSGGSFVVERATLNSGGARSCDTAGCVAPQYEIVGTIGQPVVGVASSSSNPQQGIWLYGGFWHTLSVGNTAPTITAAAGLSRQQGSQSSRAVIATVSDDAGSGAAVVTGAGTINGITLSNISNAKGTISGDLIASCSATAAAFTLVATDANNQTATATLNVAAAVNTPPETGQYANTVLSAGGAGTVTPSMPPGDNGEVSTVTVSAPGLAVAPTISPTGVVNLADVGPVGSYTVTVRVTDNCNAVSTSAFQLTVNASGGDPVITPIAVTRAQGSANFRSVIANVSDLSGAGNVTVTAAAVSGSGVVISGIQNNNGQISALLRAGCFATNSTFSLTANNGSNSNVATLPVSVTPSNNPNWCQWWPR